MHHMVGLVLWIWTWTGYIPIIGWYECHQTRYVSPTPSSNKDSKMSHEVTLDMYHAWFTKQNVSLRIE
jgi:hypothetical protein